MASITVWNFEEGTKRKLKVRAAMNGRSMEQEVREILRTALKNTPPKSGANLAEAIHRRFARLASRDHAGRKGFIRDRIDQDETARGPVALVGIEE